MGDWDFGDVEPLFGDDPVLQLLPAELPSAFLALPAEEQSWRGRLFLMTWALTANEPYSWFQAFVDNPALCAEAKTIVAHTSDEQIAAAVGVLAL